MIKIKSIYGNLLKSNDYAELLKLPDIYQLVQYLKSNDNYSSTNFEIFSNGDRVKIENSLRASWIKIYKRILSFSPSSNIKFLDLLFFKEDIEYISNFIKKGVVSKGYVHPELKKLYINDTVSILSVLKHTPYYNLFFDNCENNIFNLERIKASSISYFFKVASTMFYENYKGKTRTYLLNLLSLWVENTNLVSVYRIKKYYPSTSQLSPYLITNEHLPLSKKVLSVLSSESPSQVLDILNKKCLSGYNANAFYANIELLSSIINNKEAKKHIYYSTNLEICFLSFFIVSQTEKDNIIRIIEGKRYNLTGVEVNSILVY
ncbi:MAG: V-type ATPase subunit [Acholeplasmatales bacterium]|nr:V-type ATPase subunit [Acholeplasmatales bacterium]